MFQLQFLYGSKHLFYWISFRLFSFVLDVYPWITLPRGLVDPVAAAALTWLSEVELTDSAKIEKPHISGVLLNLP
jgi:hypothetical protein